MKNGMKTSTTTKAAGMIAACIMYAAMPFFTTSPVSPR
jgi:hypothetical protein